MHSEFLRHTANAAGAVLFVHGFLGSPKHFEKFVKLVPDNFAVHNILLEGHGGTVTDFSHASMEKWKNQVDKATSELVKRYKNVIIMAHSMGTFFAIDAAIKYPDAVKGVLLLATPLKIGVQKMAVVNMFKSLFNTIDKSDKVGMAYQKANSIVLDKRLWLYVGWIPRCLELFKESAAAREKIKNINSKCIIFQSSKDELVTMSSLNLIPQKENISIKILENSQHFIYDKNDFNTVCTAFSKLIAEM